MRAASERGIGAVIRVEASCEPKDVIANRLDPWHGAHYHAHSFGRLRVIDQRRRRDHRARGVSGGGPAVGRGRRALHCPDPRTIVMTIVAGEGQGSVVETHATPLSAGRSAVVELTLASSERFGFAIARRASWLVRPGMAWAARRLWRDDAQYAERLYLLRKSKVVKDEAMQPTAAPQSHSAVAARHLLTQLQPIQRTGSGESVARMRSPLPITTRDSARFAHLAIADRAASILAFTASRLKLAPFCSGGNSMAVMASFATSCWTNTKRQNSYWNQLKYS